MDGQSNHMDFASEWSTGVTETVRAFIKNGADVKAKDEFCLTPLHLASSSGRYVTMGILIEHGADVAAKDTSDRTPLHLALSPWVGLLIQHWLM